MYGNYYQRSDVCGKCGNPATLNGGDICGKCAADLGFVDRDNLGRPVPTCTVCGVRGHQGGH